jgi:DnaJ-domain-containing protein 1
VFLFYLLIGSLLLYLGLLALRAATSTPPAQLIQLGKWLFGGLVAVVALFLLASGRAGNAVEVLLVLTPLFVRWRGLWQSLRNVSGPQPGQSSAVETAWLRMSLDHDSGAMDGVVLQGPRRGARLSECGRDDLVALLGELRVQDQEAAELLEAYLDRVHPDWRAGAAAGEAGGEAPARESAAMTREEAYRILGLEPGADTAAIRAAHRRLMVKLHPDQGGSTYLAAKINQAKDVLTHPSG